MLLSDLCILTYGMNDGQLVSTASTEGMWWVRYKDGREQGVLAVYRRLEPSEHDQILVYLLEDQPAVRMSTTRTARQRQLQVLVRFCSQLAAAASLPDLYRAVDECMRDAFREVQALSMWVYDQTNARLKLALASGYPDEDELSKLADHADFRAMVERKGIRIEDAQSLEPFAGSAAFAGARSITLIPMRSGAGLEAVLVFTSAEEKRKLGDANLRLMQALGTLAAMVLQKLMLIEDLRTASRMLVEAQDTERQAISQDIHDEIGGLLSSLSLVLKLVPIDHPSVRNEINDAIEIVDEIISHIRDLSFRLSPPMLTELGLVPTIGSLTKRFSALTRIGVMFHNELDPDSRYEKATESTAYRIVQESLTNASKHSDAGAIQIHTRAEDDSIIIHIMDDGSGFDPAKVAGGSRGMGLRGLRERVAMLGGSLEIASVPGEGTRISAVLPMTKLE